MKFCKFILIACSFIALASCSKSEVEKERDLYFDVDGGIFGGGHGYYKNYYWTSVSVGTTLPITGSMFVDGNDVYYPTIGGYLKNGDLVQLPEAEVISSVFAKNGEVYAAGSREPYGASYWKNGQLVKLEPDSSDYSANALKIIVSNDHNIYVGGEMRKAAKNRVVYWKNNIMYQVEEESSFEDMAILNNYVHIVGELRNNFSEGAYWINGIKMSLMGFDGKKPQSLTSISVWGNDVYITGRYADALYWKNGVPESKINKGIVPKGVVVNNRKVLVAANMVLPQSSGPQYRMMLWTDGVPDTFGSGEFYGIYLGK